MTTARGTVIGCAVLMGMTLTACSGDDEPSDKQSSEEPPASIASVNDIPGSVLLIKPGSAGAPQTYRTAEVTQAEGSPGSTTVNVNFEAGPDLCSMVTGYATEETDSDILVTVIVGEKKGCTGDKTLRTTVLNLDKPVGERDVEVSKYSKTSIPIERAAE